MAAANRRDPGLRSLPPTSATAIAGNPEEDHVAAHVHYWMNVNAPPQPASTRRDQSCPAFQIHVRSNYTFRYGIQWLTIRIAALPRSKPYQRLLVFAR